MVFTPGYISINVHNKRALLGKYSPVEALVKKCHPLRKKIRINSGRNRIEAPQKS